MIEILKELSFLFRPYADMYSFQILDHYLRGREVSEHFGWAAAVMFVLALFINPESRKGSALFARVLFLGLLLLLLRSQGTKAKDADDN